jgi:hypothetical protein
MIADSGWSPCSIRRTFLHLGSAPAHGPVLDLYCCYTNNSPPWLGAPRCCRRRKQSFQLQGMGMGRAHFIEHVAGEVEEAEPAGLRAGRG